MRNRSVLFLILFVLLLASSINAERYINSTSGNDANTGLSPSQAWKTLAKAEATYLTGGENIYLSSCEGPYRGQFKYNGGSGTSGNPGILTSYGCTDRKAEIWGSANFTLASCWERIGATNIYKSNDSCGSPGTVAYTTETHEGTSQIFYNVSGSIQMGQRHETADLPLTANWDFFHNRTDGKMYVYHSGGNPGNMSGGLELPIYNTSGYAEPLVYYEGKNYITVSNIKIAFAKGLGLTFTGTYANVTNTDFRYVYQKGLKFDSSSDNSVAHNNTFYQVGIRGLAVPLGRDGMGENLWLLGDNLVITHNKIELCGGVCINYYHQSGSVTEYNIINNSHLTTTVGDNPGGIYWDGCSNGVARYNNISDVISGIIIGTESTSYNSSNFLIEYNMISNTKMWAIGTSTDVSPIAIRMNNITVLHNTLVETMWYGASGGGRQARFRNYNGLNFSDNLVYNSYTNTSGYLAYVGNSTTYGRNYSGDHNLYRSLNRQYWEYQSATASALSTWRTLTGHEAHSIDDNPMLSDVAAKDFAPEFDSPACTASSNGTYVGAVPCKTNSSNAAPEMIGVRISPTLVYDGEETTLEGYCNASDADDTILSYNYTWYLNGALNATGVYYEPTTQCYQEDVDVVNQRGTDGSCSQNYSGNQLFTTSGGGSWQGSENATDGDPLTCARYSDTSSTYSYYANYSRPATNITSSTWSIILGDNVERNTTLEATCLDSADGFITVRAYIQPIALSEYATVVLYCYSGDIDDGWELLEFYASVHLNNEALCDEGLFFEVSSIDAGVEKNINDWTTTLSTGDNVIFSCMASDLEEETTWMNSSTLTISEVSLFVFENTSLTTTSNTTVLFDTQTNVTAWNINDTTIILTDATWVSPSGLCTDTLTFNTPNSSFNMSEISCSELSINILNGSMTVYTENINKIFYNVTNTQNLTSTCTLTAQNAYSAENYDMIAYNVISEAISNITLSPYVHQGLWNVTITCIDEEDNTATTSQINVTMMSNHIGVTNITSLFGENWIFLNWTNPADNAYTGIYINSVNVANTNISEWNFTGLSINTTYNITFLTNSIYSVQNTSTYQYSTAILLNDLEFTDNTPYNNSLIKSTSVTVEVIADEFGDPKTITLRCYDEVGSLMQTNTITNDLLTINYTLSFGTYYFIATATNGTHYDESEVRIITLYNTTQGNITNPLNNSQITSQEYNITWTAWTSTTSLVNLSYYNLTRLNEDSTHNETITESGTNTSILWNASPVKRGTFYLKLCGIFTNTDEICTVINLTKNDTPPTTPSWNTTPTDIFYDVTFFFNASGSTDADGDPITIKYEVYNLNDSTILQPYGIATYYTPVSSDIGDLLQIRAKATTDYGDSSEITFNISTPVMIGSATFYFIREATGDDFNISGAEQIKMSIYCSTEVETIIINGTYSKNFTCLYDFIKIDVEYNSSSYFRIIKPDTSQNMTVQVYLLDLNEDTGVEKIITINDLTGDYSDGLLSVKRYLNGSEITIIKTPFDIERSVDLFLLKDQLYTIIVENNEGSVRVLGNLIASAAGTSTLTLPELNFNPSDVNLGNKIDWDYDYSKGTGGVGGYISFTYFDLNNGTESLRFRVRYANGSTLFDTSLNDVYNETSSISITVPLPNGNLTYYSDLYLIQDALNQLNETRQHAPPGNTIPETDVDDDFLPNTRVAIFWTALIFLFLLGLSFDTKTSHVGLVVVAIFMSIFIAWGFLYFGLATGLITSLIGVISVLNYITKSRKETGGD